MAHTPGPWFYDQADLEVFSEVEGSGVVVAVRGTNDAGQKMSNDEMEANARLAAAAPDLLAALIKMGEEFDTYAACKSQDDACRMADAAIQKATGGE